MNTPEHNEYGPVLKQYQGHGMLTSGSAGQAPCKFRVFQLRDGGIIALCDLEQSDQSRTVAESAETITGETTGGHGLEAAGLFWTSLHSTGAGIATTYRVDGLEIDPEKWLQSSKSRFLLTNLTLFPEPILVNHPIGPITIQRLDDYEEVVDRLRVTKSIDVTAQLDVVERDLQARCVAADDVCYLLSIARGTKVNWIARADELDGTILRENRSSRITKPYGSLPVIDYRQSEDTGLFLNATFETYLQRRDTWGLSLGLIDAYLDAKSATDYLQLRGVKLAAAIEMLKASFMTAKGQSRLIRPESEFQKIKDDLKKRVKDVLNEAQWNTKERSSLYKNLLGLNSISFEDVLREMLEYFGLVIPENEVDLFVKCRNSLIHNCRFYCEIPTQDWKTTPPPQGPTEEFKLLCHFADRLFLRLVGYRGPYIDWSGPYPERRETF